MNDSARQREQAENQDQANWGTFKDKLKETWSKLSEEDLKLAQQAPEEFFGKVRDRHGISVEDAERLYNRLADTCQYNHAARNEAA